MRRYNDRRWVKFSTEQMFDLVADVPSYPQFLPWCLETRTVRQVSDSVFHSEMVVGYKHFRERYKSEVKLSPHDVIEVKSLDGLFKELYTRWTFESAPQGGCHVGFQIRFRFKSKLLQVMIGTVFHESARVMVRAFEKRAEFVYGSQP